MYPDPNDRYIEYMESLAETGDLETMESYDAWVEATLEEM